MNGYQGTDQQVERAPRNHMPSRSARLVRLLRSCLDPRAWAHLLKLVNFHNYSHVQPLRSITRGCDVRISPTASFAHGQRIRLGDRVSIGESCRLWAGPKHGSITLEDDVLLGPEVLITAASYQYNRGRPVAVQPMSEAQISIGADTWLGAKVVVLPGARIGMGCVIAAGSVVRTHIPDYTLAAGNPAQAIGMRATSDHRCQEPTSSPGDQARSSP